MKPIHHVARYAALATAVAIVASCDTRLQMAGPNAADDVIRPQIQFVLSAGVNNTADVGTPLTVSVTALDDFGVSRMQTQIMNGTQLIGLDTATIKPAEKEITRDIPVQLGGLTSGTKITIRTTVTDGATNAKIDSLVITITDTAGPVMTVSSIKASQPVKGGDTLDIRVSAADSSGIVYAGYRVLRNTDSFELKADSVILPTGTKLTKFLTPPFSYVLPATALPGNYTIFGFARDRSGMYTKAGTPGLPFTVIDVLKPTLSYTTPVMYAAQKIGDPIFLTTQLQDNASVQKVTFEGVSIRVGQTIVRYPKIQRTFLPGVRNVTSSDTLLVAPGTPDAVADTLFVTGILTDLAGKADTVRLKLLMVP